MGEANDRKTEKTDNPLYYPEWLFVVNKAQDVDLIKNRTILVHTPSFSILEVIARAGKEIKYKVPFYEFVYIDNKGLRRKYKFFMYYTLSKDIYLTFRQAAVWYNDFLEWKDNELLKEERSREN